VLNKDFPVVILCGGKGTRLREETELRPKPMVEIGGIPILLHIIKYYASFGFYRFVLALGYKGDYIKNYFYNYRINSSNFTITFDPEEEPKIHSISEESHLSITCVDTGENTLKGGRIKRLEQFIDTDHFLMTYGDGLCDVDLERLVNFHMGHDGLGTITGVHPPSRFGELIYSGDDVDKFDEKPQMHTGLINGGFFVFRKDFLSYLTEDENCDLEYGALNQIASEKKLKIFKHYGFWQCMDNVRERDYLNTLWYQNEAPWKSWT
jgi:glucose-1-phosphate cytidylyltransferase